MHAQPVRNLRVERAAWPAAISAIFLIDLYLIRNDCRTLSGQFAGACRHPSWKWLTLGAWGFLTLHLVDLVPDRVDPLSRLAGLLSKREKAS